MIPENRSAKPSAAVPLLLPFPSNSPRHFFLPTVSFYSTISPHPLTSFVYAHSVISFHYPPPSPRPLFTPTVSFHSTISHHPLPTVLCPIYTPTVSFYSTASSKPSVSTGSTTSCHSSPPPPPGQLDFAWMLTPPPHTPLPPPNPALGEPRKRLLRQLCTRPPRNGRGATGGTRDKRKSTAVEMTEEVWYEVVNGRQLFYRNAANDS